MNFGKLVHEGIVAVEMREYLWKNVGVAFIQKAIAFKFGLIYKIY